MPYDTLAYYLVHEPTSNLHMVGIVGLLACYRHTTVVRHLCLPHRFWQATCVQKGTQEHCIHVLRQ